MNREKLIITPQTKIGELLEAYPQLEEVLISLSPVFNKLRNPVLRKTVARVATIRQVSAVGGIPVETIVNRLRSELGQTELSTNGQGDSNAGVAPPSWFDEKIVASSFDATPVINAGESPMSEVLRKASSLREGEILELRTPFMPAPIIDMLNSKGYLTYTRQAGDVFLNYIRKG